MDMMEKNEFISAFDLIEKNPKINIKNGNPSFTKQAIYNTEFWYYTSFKTADKILDNHCFFCRNLNEMNDKSEAKLHYDESDYVHALCFCNSKTEKIPMWYLYSGIMGNGISIGFTATVMTDFIKSIKTVTDVDKKKTLYIGSDFDLECGWVFYQKKDSPRIVKYKSDLYSVYDIENFEKNNFFIIDYPWEYEKEFRIIIKNKTNVKYEKLVIDFPEKLYKKIKIRFAPEMSESHFLNLIPDNKGFQKLLSKKLEYSKLSIKMDLYKRNKEDIVNHLSDFISADDINEEDARKYCEVIKKSNGCKVK